MHPPLRRAVFPHDGAVVVFVEDEYGVRLLHDGRAEHTGPVTREINAHAPRHVDGRFRRAAPLVREVTRRDGAPRPVAALSSQTLGKRAATDVSEAHEGDRLLSPSLQRASLETSPHERKPKPQAPRRLSPVPEGSSRP